MKKTQEGVGVAACRTAAFHPVVLARSPEDGAEAFSLRTVLDQVEEASWGEAKERWPDLGWEGACKDLMCWMKKKTWTVLEAVQANRR